MEKIMLNQLWNHFKINKLITNYQSAYRSYLVNRQFSVQTEDQLSEVKTIDSSVPQGSILGSVLFTCYASTLQELFMNHNSLSGYADGHSFIKSFNQLTTKFLQNLSLVSNILVIGCIRITLK